MTNILTSICSGEGLYSISTLVLSSTNTSKYAGAAGPSSEAETSLGATFGVNTVKLAHACPETSLG